MFSYLNPLPHLPDHYPGPHKVGTTEVEIPISDIESTTTIPDSSITTIKFRLYYPTAQNAKSDRPIYWVQDPQKESNDAFASFLGADTGVMSYVTKGGLSMWNHAKIPAIRDAPLLPTSQEQKHPVCFFSHGLGGNFNTYSSICGTLASCGIVCIAPEHRDGSAPVTFVRNAKGQIESTVSYKKVSHQPTPEMLNARNTQLRSRLWELDLLYAATTALNSGKIFTNYAVIGNEKDNESWKQTSKTFARSLNLGSGQVTWAGHSFGATTMTQFVKSVFYHKSLPEAPSSDSNSESRWDWRPLLQCTSDSPLVKQITPESPIALLDLWTMPLRGDTTKWLWEHPMPCYHRESISADSKAPNMVSIISAEFYKWTDLLNRTRAVLARNPPGALEAFQSKKPDEKSAAPAAAGDTRPQAPVPELSKLTSETEQTMSQARKSSLQPPSADLSRSPSPSQSQSHSEASSPRSSATSLAPSMHNEKTPSTNEPHFYLVPQSAHLSQSDFGVLFPNLTKYVMKAIEPEKTIELNVRAILAVMKGRGLHVDSLLKGADEDQILSGEAKEARWVRVPLVDG